MNEQHVALRAMIGAATAANGAASGMSDVGELVSHAAALSVVLEKLREVGTGARAIGPELRGRYPLVDFRDLASLAEIEAPTLAADGSPSETSPTDAGIFWVCVRVGMPRLIAELWTILKTEGAL